MLHTQLSYLEFRIVPIFLCCLCKLVLDKGVRPYNRTTWLYKGECQHYYCDYFTRLLNFSCDGCKKKESTWIFAFTVKITLQFTHSGYAHKRHCIVQASICSSTGCLDVSYSLSVVGQYFYIRCSIDHMYACILFFFYEQNKLQSIFFLLISLVITESENNHWKTNMLYVIAMGKYSVSMPVSFI